MLRGRNEEVLSLDLEVDADTTDPVTGYAFVAS